MITKVSQTKQKREPSDSTETPQTDSETRQWLFDLERRVVLDKEFIAIKATISRLEEEDVSPLARRETLQVLAAIIERKTCISPDSNLINKFESLVRQCPEPLDKNVINSLIGLEGPAISPGILKLAPGEQPTEPDVKGFIRYYLGKDFNKFDSSFLETISKLVKATLSGNVYQPTSREINALCTAKSMASTDSPLALAIDASLKLYRKSYERFSAEPSPLLFLKSKNIKPDCTLQYKLKSYTVKLIAEDGSLSLKRVRPKAGEANEIVVPKSEYKNIKFRNKRIVGAGKPGRPRKDKTASSSDFDAPLGEDGDSEVPE